MYVKWKDWGLEVVTSMALRWNYRGDLNEAEIVQP